MSMQAKTHRPPASNAGRVAAALFLVVALFHFGLMAGAPWGEASLGGAYAGVLPDTLRIGSIVSLAFYVLLAAVAGTSWTGSTLRRRVLYGAALLMVVGALLNIASPSFIERIIWAPVTVALVIALWHAARHSSLARVTEAIPRLAPLPGTGE